MMATLDDVIEGMEIIRRYSAPVDCVKAEDGQILCGKYTGDKMSVSDRFKMGRLGWFEDKDWDAWSCYT